MLAYPVPVRSMIGDGNVGRSSVNEVVTVGMDSVVCTLEQMFICHVAS